MKPHITPDDRITIKRGYFFNYYRRIKKIKLAHKGEPLTLCLNRTRSVVFFPNILEMKIPICLYGIYTNGCVFDYADLSSGDKLKLDHFYPEIGRWLISYKHFKKMKVKKIVSKTKSK